MKWKGPLGDFDFTPASKSKISDAPGQVREGSSATVWEAKCDDGSKVISGSCIKEKGAAGIGLQNIGPNRSANRWECAWTAPVIATVRAVCLKDAN